MKDEEKKCKLMYIVDKTADTEVPLLVCEDKDGRIHFTLPSEDEVRILKVLIELKKEAEKHISEKK